MIVFLWGLSCAHDPKFLGWPQTIFSQLHPRRVEPPDQVPVLYALLLRQVIKLSRVPSIHSLSSSSTIQTACQTCKRRMPHAASWSCDRRSDAEHANKPVTCFYCQLEVRGRYTYCQSCSFGGHSACVKKWIKWREANGKPIGCKYHRV